MNLSRRSLLTGLLSSAAVVAAGPVINLAEAPRDLVVYGRSPGMMALDDLKILEGMHRRLIKTFIYGNPEASPLQFAGFTPFYDGKAA